VKQIL